MPDTHGGTSASRGSSVGPNNRFHFKGLPQRAYDPDKAKWHLQKANLGSTAILVVVSPAATNSVEIALVLQHAQDIGLNLKVKRMPADGYWSTHWMKHPVGFGNVNARPSADLALPLFFKSDAPWNEAAWRNEKFDQLLVAARGETDAAKRANMYADMQVMIHNRRRHRGPDVHLQHRRAQRQAEGAVADTARRDDGLQLRRTRLAGRMTPSRSQFSAMVGFDR